MIDIMLLAVRVCRFRFPHPEVLDRRDLSRFDPSPGKVPLYSLATLVRPRSEDHFCEKVFGLGEKPGPAALVGHEGRGARFDAYLRQAACTFV